MVVRSVTMRRCCSLACFAKGLGPITAGVEVMAGLAGVVHNSPGTDRGCLPDLAHHLHHQRIAV